MAHNIDTMFSLRQKPWHGLGQIVQEAPTMEEAIRLAGLDWSVSRRPIFIEASDDPIPGKFALVRDDRDHPLGICGTGYSPIQNRDAFRFLDQLAADGLITWETAGALGEGEKIWVLAKLGQTLDVRGDAIEPYTLFCNPTANNGSALVMSTPTRVVCQNTLNFAMGGLKRGAQHLRIRHQGNVMDKLADARQALGIILADQKKLVEFGRAAAGTEITDAKIHAFLDSFLPDPETPDRAAFKSDEDFKKSQVTHERRVRRMSTKREEVRALVDSKTNQTEATSGTLWGLFNAATEWADHESTRKSSTEDADHVWFGAAVPLKQQAFEAATPLI